MPTRLTVHVRHTNKDMMFYKSEPVKTYYYKDGKQEKVIGNEDAYQRNSHKWENYRVFTKMTKARRRIRTTQTFIIESMSKNIIKQHVQNILSNLKAKGYNYSWVRPDRGGALVDHWYLSNTYKCN